MAALKIEGRLQPKNQITLPEKIAARLGVEPGDRFVFVMEDGESDVVHLRRLRKSYAGIAADVYGSSQDSATYLEEERQAWAE
ncbi:MAG: AbrB/MazE/SpoVT family DNA-binding domain-containing protein [Chloroflexota bacterium]|nr:AbrB/MazE/SpoVT family DNA-binding domain-containing protein [Chloroflexota bacterium]